MTEFSLLPHPHFPSAAVSAISVSVDRKDSFLSLEYAVSGALEQVKWPAPAASVRTDELWKHTCLEAFVGHPQTGYAEYNFSPSGAWASYFFDWYRDGMRPLIWHSEPVLHFAVRPGVYRIRAEIEVDPGDGDSHLALSAIIEAKDGTKSYWALAHPPGKPDFHNADCFTARLAAPDRA